MRVTIFCFFLLQVFCSMFAWGHGDLHERIEEISAQIKHKPARADLFLKRGELYLEHEQFAEAISDLERAQKLDFKLSLASYLKAKAFFETKNNERAKESIDSYLKQVSDDPSALALRARIDIRLGKDPRKDFAAALSQKDPPPDIYIERARYLKGKGAAYLDEAIGGLEEGIKKLGPLVSFHSLIIEIEKERHHFDKALEHIDIIIAQMNRKESSLLQKGDILSLAGRFSEAKDVYAKALSAIESLPDHLQKSPTTRDLKALLKNRLSAKKTN